MSIIDTFDLMPTIDTFNLMSIIYTFNFMSIIDTLSLMAIIDTFNLIKNSEWVWSGNTTITNRRQPCGTAIKSRLTITRH